MPGTECRLAVDWWDGPLPVPGDFLRTAAGSCYLIGEFSRSRVGSKRIGTFICTRLEGDAVAFGEPGVFGWEFARRVRGRGC